MTPQHFADYLKTLSTAEANETYAWLYSLVGHDGFEGEEELDAAWTGAGFVQASYHGEWTRNAKSAAPTEGAALEMPGLTGGQMVTLPQLSEGSGQSTSSG